MILIMILIMFYKIWSDFDLIRFLSDFDFNFAGLGQYSLGRCEGALPVGSTPQIYLLGWTNMRQPHTRDKEKFIFYMDNCTAQNKNWTIYIAIVYEVNRPGVLMKSYLNT